jgi:hypothetical protein
MKGKPQEEYHNYTCERLTSDMVHIAGKSKEKKSYLA